MITPLDIENKRFAKQMMNGYNVEEVDDFLDELTEDYTKNYKEVNELRAKVEELNNSLVQYKAIESTLQDTLVMAQTTAEEVKNVAKQKADQIVEEAKATAQKQVDDLNNEIEVTRTIYVYNKNPDIPVGDKVIYLTFDDGPSNYTNTLLDILKKYNVKATFFVTSNGSDDTIKKAYQEGHSIGIHSYSHKYNEIYKSEEAFFKDVDKVNERIKRITGEYSRILRFAGGSSNTVSRFNKGIMTRLSKEVELRGYKYFDWNVSSSDTATKDSNKIANNVIRSLRKGNNVVLQHDTNYGSVKAVEQIIQYGLSHGYVFDALNITSPTVHHAINN